MIDFNQLPPEALSKIQAALLEAKQQEAFRAQNRFDAGNGSFVPRLSPFLALAQGLTNRESANQGQAALQRAQALAIAARERGNQDRKDFFTTLQGSPMPATGGPALPPNPTGAIQQAISSDFPGVQQAGQALAEGRAKQAAAREQAIMGALLKNTTNAGINQFQQTGNTSDLTDAPKILDSQGAIISVDPAGQSAPTSLTPNRFQQGTTMLPGQGVVPTNLDTLSGKNIPLQGTASTKVSVNTGEKRSNAFQDKVIGSNFDKIQKQGQDIADAAETLNNAVKATELLKAGALTGPFAEQRRLIGKSVGVFGGKVDPDVARGEQLARTLGLNALKAGKAVFPVTDTDLKKLDDLFGSGNNSPETIAQILETSIRVSLRLIKQHENLVQDTEQRARTFDPSAQLNNFRIPVPEEFQTNGRDISETLRQMQVPGAFAGSGQFAKPRVRREAFRPQ